MKRETDGSSLADLHFDGRKDVAPQLLDRALSHVSKRGALQVLDLGCGTGEVALAAAQVLPDARILALDISPANVEAARAAAVAAGVGAQVTTMCADYLRWSGDQFDLVISDGVLQLIRGTDDELASRLASDLAPGGVLVATMPITSTGNSLRMLLRRLWRGLPASADRLALAIAQRLHPDFSTQALADRLPYLRILPERLFGPELAVTFAAHGLELREDSPWESLSAAKLEHHLIALRRRGSGSAGSDVNRASPPR